MKKKVIVLLILFFLCSASSVVFAFDVVDFGLGCATSFLLHESAHWLVGNSTGRLEFVSKESNPLQPWWIYYGNDKGLFKTAVAGFQMDWIVREYYLQKRPESDIWKGMFWYTVYHHLLYCFDDGGDVRAIKESSGIRIGSVHSVLALLTALDVYRYFHPELPKINVLLIPKGIVLGYTIRF